MTRKEWFRQFLFEMQLIENEDRKVKLTEAEMWAKVDKAMLRYPDGQNSTETEGSRQKQRKPVL